MAKRIFKKKISPHKNFKRSYREDYRRDLDVPGVGHHIYEAFRMIFVNARLFFPLLGILVILSLLLVGMTGEMGGVSGVFGVLLFLTTWLVVIFLLRHLMAKHKVCLRDGFYNAMTPLVSTLVVFLVVVLQSVPILILIVVYSAAVKTEFLTMPFYALLFFIFAALMVLISGYLLSSSLIALIAVSAPGLYPMRALETASELMMGRRVRFMIRILAMILVIVAIFIVILGPLTMFDLWMKNFEWAKEIPFIPFVVTILTWFSAIYMTTYLYIYYRWLLEA